MNWLSKKSEQKHTCKGCNFYVLGRCPVPPYGDCKIEKEVVEKHSQEEYDYWMLNISKENNCSLWKKGD